MSPETVTTLINGIAEKLEIPVAQLMLVLPRIGYKDVVLVGIILCMALFSFFFVVLFASLLAKAERYCDTDYSFFVGLCFVALCFFLIILFFELPSALLWLRDPEAWAYDYLFKKF